MNLKTSNRDLSVDSVKGLCVFFIVCGHVALGWILDEFVNTTILGAFFILSGLFYKNGKSITEVLRIQWKRLGISFSFFVIIGYLYHWIYAVWIESSHFRYDMLVTDLYHGSDYEANIPCWFFISLFEIILIFHFVNKLAFGYALVVSIFLSLTGNYLLSIEINDFYFSKSMYYFPLFYLGHHCLTSTRMKWKQIGNSGIYSLYMLTFLLLIIKSLFVESLFWNYYLDSLSSLTFTFAALATFDGYRFRFQVLEYLGKNSLVIFAFHILVLDFVWRVLYPIFHTPNFCLRIVYVLIVMIGCIPMVYIYNRYRKK